MGRIIKKRQFLGFIMCVGIKCLTFGVCHMMHFIICCFKVEWVSKFWGVTFLMVPPRMGLPNYSGIQGQTCMHKGSPNFDFKGTMYISRSRGHECDGNGLSPTLVE
jgi:hypothetical protein